jgi:hypothetical protein
MIDIEIHGTAGLSRRFLTSAFWQFGSRLAECTLEQTR